MCWVLNFNCYIVHTVCFFCVIAFSCFIFPILSLILLNVFIMYILNSGLPGPLILIPLAWTVKHVHVVYIIIFPCVFTLSWGVSATWTDNVYLGRKTEIQNPTETLLMSYWVYVMWGGGCTDRKYSLECWPLLLQSGFDHSLFPVSFFFLSWALLIFQELLPIGLEQGLGLLRGSDILLHLLLPTLQALPQATQILSSTGLSTALLLPRSERWAMTHSEQCGGEKKMQGEWCSPVHHLPDHLLF